MIYLIKSLLPPSDPKDSEIEESEYLFLWGTHQILYAKDVLYTLQGKHSGEINYDHMVSLINENFITVLAVEARDHKSWCLQEPSK